MDPEHVSSGSFIIQKTYSVLQIMLTLKHTPPQIKWTIAGAIFLCLIQNSLFAEDFESGLNAYQEGDFLTARENWIKSAQMGDTQAQYRLGLMLANGEGGTRDVVAAYAWLSIAARNGVSAAGPLSKKLSKDYVPRHCQYEAMALVREFLTGLSDRLVTGESRDSRCWKFDAPNRR